MYFRGPVPKGPVLFRMFADIWYNKTIVSPKGFCFSEGSDFMQISIYGILFVVSIILILIFISIQYTLNQILKELRQLKNRVGYRNDVFPSDKKK